MRLPFAAASRFFASSSAALAVSVYTPVSTYKGDPRGRSVPSASALRFSNGCSSLNFERMVNDVVCVCEC